MRKWLWKLRVPLALLALYPLYHVWVYTELLWGIPARARTDAWRNYQRRIFMLPGGHGYATSPRFEYKRLLRERYKVVQMGGGGCMQYLDEAIYDDNYYAEMTRLINKFYGKDVFEECSKEAEKDQAKDMFGYYGKVGR